MSPIRFTVSAREADLIDSVLGQMSDGKWENNRSYEKFWKSIDIIDTTDVVVNIDKLCCMSSYSYRYSRSFEKDFASPESIKKFFGRKAQIVHNDDIRDNLFGILRGNENEHAKYLDSYRTAMNQTYGEIQETINMLKGKIK